MQFRRAVITDSAQLIILRLAYLSEDYHGLTDEQNKIITHQLTDYFYNHLDKDLFAYISTENTEIISTVFMLVIEKPANPSFLTGKTGTILNVYTKPNYRRQGLAESLMTMAMEDARQMGLSLLELKATTDGLPLYTRLGFAPEISKYTNMKYLL